MKGHIWILFSAVIFGLAGCGGKDSAPSNDGKGTYWISGAVTSGGRGLQGVTLTLSTFATATTDSSGTYSFSGLPSGNYTITPRKTGFSFNVSSRSVALGSVDLTGVNFLTNEALLVTNADDGTVVVVDPGTESVIHTIGVGTTPGHVAVIPSLNRAFIGNLTKNSISVLDSAEQSVVSSITVTMPIGGLDVNAETGLVYGLDFDEGGNATELHVIDSSTNMAIAHVSAGTNVQDIRIDPAANQAYITDFNEGLKVLDLTNNTILKTVAIPGRPHGIAVDSAASLAYITQVEGNSVAIVSLATETIVSTVPTGTSPQWVALNSDRSKAYVTNEGSGTVSVIDTTTRTVTASIPVGQNPFYIIADPDADLAYVTNTGSNTVSKISTTTDAVMGTINVGAVPIGIAIRP